MAKCKSKKGGGKKKGMFLLALFALVSVALTGCASIKTSVGSGLGKQIIATATALEVPHATIGYIGLSSGKVKALGFNAGYATMRQQDYDILTATLRSMRKDKLTLDDAYNACTRASEHDTYILQLLQHTK